MGIHNTGLAQNERGSAVVAPLLASPSTAMMMLQCGRTHLYELIAAGELESFKDGRSRKISTKSIHDYVRPKLEASPKAA